jgi:hypothetical protein
VAEIPLIAQELIGVLVIVFNCGKDTINSTRMIRGVRDSRLLGYQLTLGSVQIDLRRKVGARVFL